MGEAPPGTGPGNEKGGGGPLWLSDAAISIHLESVLFHSHAANAPLFLLTSVNLFIYLNQITNKSKIRQVCESFHVVVLYLNRLSYRKSTLKSPRKTLLFH